MVVVVTEESNDAVGVTIVAQADEIADGYLFNGRLSLFSKLDDGRGGRNLLFSSNSCVAKSDGFVLRKICDGDDGDDDEFDDDEVDEERSEGTGNEGGWLFRWRQGDEQCRHECATELEFDGSRRSAERRRQIDWTFFSIRLTFHIS